MADSSTTPSFRQGIAAYYDRLAGSYGDGAAFAARRAAILRAIADDVAGAQVILDVGCGNGTYLVELATRSPAAQIVGIDLSPEMLHAAAARVGGRACLVRGDALALPFESEQFDIVFMSHVLQLVPDVEGCIAEVARCLAPGGLLISTLGTGRWREALLPVLDDDILRELSGLTQSARSRTPSDDPTRVTAACAAAALQPMCRDLMLSIDWAAIEEFIRVRWFPVVDEATQRRAESWLERARAQSSERTLSMSETLLVARKGPPRSAP